MVRMHSDWWVHAVQGECCLNSMDGILVCPKGHDKAESLREFGGLKAQSWHHWGVAHACASFCHGCLKALPHSLPECEVPVFLPACTDFCLNYTEFNSFIYNLLLLLFFFLLWILAHISELGSCVKSDPSVQLSLNVCKCPSLNTEHWRVCIDVFVLFKKKVISSGLSFEFTRLWIIDQNSSNLQNPWHRLSHLILSINLGVKVLISPH